MPAAMVWDGALIESEGVVTFSPSIKPFMITEYSPLT